MKEELLELGMSRIIDTVRDYLNEPNDRNLALLTKYCGLQKCSNCEQWEDEDELQSPEENSDIGYWCEQCLNDRF